MSSLSSEIAALEAKRHRTITLFHAADMNCSMVLANATCSNAFLSKHKVWEMGAGEPGWVPLGCAGVCLIYFGMRFAGVSAINRTGDLV